MVLYLYERHGNQAVLTGTNLAIINYEQDIVDYFIYLRDYYSSSKMIIRYMNHRFEIRGWTLTKRVSTQKEARAKKIFNEVKIRGMYL